jgi:DNA-3-methyladenine glycosylase
MKKLLSKDFFDRPGLVVARELLGKYLVRQAGSREIAVMITEVETYGGPGDLASHARFGNLGRSKPMWERGGTIYVYFCYGVHWMLNVVVGEAGEPGAVLIRGVEGASGPGRLTKLLKIDKKLNGIPLGKKSGLWIEDRGVKVSPKDIKKTPRIGVTYAGDWAKKPWRFVLKKKGEH